MESSLKNKSEKLDRKTVEKYLLAKGREQKKLFASARQVREKTFSKKVWFRGIIEFSNLCRNNCFYCGIRAGNKKVHRYKMSLAEIKKSLDFIKRANYGSVVLQSGELYHNNFKNYLLKIVKFIHRKYPSLGIAISCGEQSYNFYKQLKQAGVLRYLLRIETSNQKLYKKLHPQNMSWKKRFQCLKWLKELGFQVGTGIMIGLPGQTLDDLVDDLVFFKKNEFDMYGLGPYVIHQDTPLITPKIKKEWLKNQEEIYNLTLNFLAILRIANPLVNIAAATALDVFNPLGRIKALQVGANIIMPAVTPKNHRQDYLLYEGKPCLEETSEKCRGCLDAKIRAAGLEPVYNEQGNSPFYYYRTFTSLRKYE